MKWIEKMKHSNHSKLQTKKPKLSAGKSTKIDKELDSMSSTIAKTRFNTVNSLPTVNWIALYLVAEEEHSIELKNLAPVLKEYHFSRLDTGYFEYSNENNAPASLKILNMIQPGTFEKIDCENSTTPGIVILLAIDKQHESLTALFDVMIKLGKELEDSIDHAKLAINPTQIFTSNEMYEQWCKAQQQRLERVS